MGRRMRMQRPENSIDPAIAAALVRWHRETFGTPEEAAAEGVALVCPLDRLRGYQPQWPTSATPPHAARLAAAPPPPPDTVIETHSNAELTAQFTLQPGGGIAVEAKRRQGPIEDAFVSIRWVSAGGASVLLASDRTDHYGLVRLIPSPRPEGAGYYVVTVMPQNADG
jgi:hypothetical protein